MTMVTLEALFLFSIISIAGILVSTLYMKGALLKSLLGYFRCSYITTPVANPSI